MIGLTRIGRFFSILAAAAVLTACGVRNPYTSPPESPRGSDDLTEVDLTDYATVMEAVQALRPVWLNQRTPMVLSARSGSGAEPGNPVWVYWDGTRLGDPTHLTRIATGEVSRIVHYDARAASVRWGISHENGVIYLVPAVGSAGPVFK